jgi:hypothetical protein
MWYDANVSDDHATSIFRVKMEKYIKKIVIEKPRNEETISDT